MPDELKNRNEIPAEAKWNVEAVYASDDEWENDFGETAAFMESMKKWAGRLGEGAGTLKAAIEELLSQHRFLEKLFTYANMKGDEDLGNSLYSGMVSRIRSRFVEFSAAHSFFTPELLGISEDTINSWLETSELEPYRTWLQDILRYRSHTLSEKEEALLANTGEIISGFSSAFGKLSNVDMPARLPEIKDENGNSVKLTSGNFSAFLQKKDRRVRKDAFLAYYSEVQGNVATKAALLEGQVKSDIFMARARKYDSALEASLFNDRVSVSVYDSLIKSVHDNLPVLHRYFQFRKNALGLDSTHMYDTNAPIVPESKADYTWDEAVDLTLEAVAPLGGEYVDALAMGFKNRWADRYENIGKRSGAYSGGCYDSHPYILHNFNGTLRSVFTLAHEAGHSMHTLLSRKSQPYHMSDYKIIVAEVASTTNEMLLIDLMLKRMNDNQEKVYLLDHLLGTFKSTLVRQTMFAEFEKLIHEHVESGNPLTPDYLSTSYYDLVKLYHGDCFAWDDEDEPVAAEWSRIPHFYYNFYVYKYATGLSSAIDISSRILAGESGAIESFIAFLKGGSSRPPLELLKEAGVDLTTPEPVNAALQKMENTLEELEKILQ
ncbi:MAG: oligoendopeptidase F [Candidatus Aegiribacteria sp.]|nr:oligoendopeptidase F [Candidatus Aegiribacteria sp.]